MWLICSSVNQIYLSNAPSLSLIHTYIDIIYIYIYIYIYDFKRSNKSCPVVFHLVLDPSKCYYAEHLVAIGLLLWQYLLGKEKFIT